MYFIYCDSNQLQLLSPLLIESAISNEFNLCQTKALALTDYLQMSNLQVKFLPPVFNFRIGSFVFPQFTDLVWVYTICCCIPRAQFPQDINNIKIVLSGSFLLYTRRHPKCNVEVSKLPSTLRGKNDNFSLISGLIQGVNIVYLHVKLTILRCFYELSRPRFTEFLFGYQLLSINILYGLKFFHFIYGNIAVNIKSMY